MKDYSIFDIIGPIMIGPSSSHTAGACRIGYTARGIINAQVDFAKFILYGSFAKTYRGHGTDVALLGGFLGFKPDDTRIRDAFTIAKEQGFSYTFEESTEEGPHPNSVRILATDIDGGSWDICGISIGGGKMTIISINGIEVHFTGDYNTLVTEHLDAPGLLARITEAISSHNINIASVRLYREIKGDKAIGIFETDEQIPPSTVHILGKTSGIINVKVINKL